MELGGLGTVFLGAPEMLLDSEVPGSQGGLERGSRVLVLLSVRRNQTITNHRNHLILSSSLAGNLGPPLFERERQTLDYLRSPEVGLKIISGDNPVGVSSIAQKAGFATITAM